MSIDIKSVSFGVMELRQLKAFIAVAETLNFRRAAEQLCMTQPPLSYAIKSLEEELGIVLINRENKKNIFLTPAGETFLLSAQRILQDVERAKTTAQLSLEGDFGVVSIGYADDFIYGPLPDLINNFNQKYPNTLLKAEQGVSYRLTTRLNRNEFDCILISPPLNKSLSVFDRITLKSTPIIAMVSNDHPLAKKTSVELKQLADERFLMVSNSMRSRFDDQISKVFLGAGLSAPATLDIMGGNLSIEMVRRGYGVALASLDSVSPHQEGIAVIHIKHKAAKLDRVLVWRADNNNPALKHFLKMAKKVYC